MSDDTSGSAGALPEGEEGLRLIDTGSQNHRDLGTIDVSGQKPQMRKFGVGVDEGSGVPRFFEVEAVNHERDDVGDMVVFKDNNGEAVLTFPSHRLVYIHTQGR